MYTVSRTHLSSSLSHDRVCSSTSLPYSTTICSCRTGCVPLKVGVILLHFFLGVAEKDCASPMGLAKSIPLENVSSDSLFPGNSLMSRWVSSEAGCTRAVLFILNILFSLASSFLIGSDDKISARVRSQLSLNEAVIERSPTALAIKKSMCCVTWENDSRRKSWAR